MCPGGISVYLVIQNYAIPQFNLTILDICEICKFVSKNEFIIPTMTPLNLRRYFRMHVVPLNSIISYLELWELFTTLLDKGRVCRHKKVAITCAYLGSKLGGVHNVMILSCTFLNIFIKSHQIHSQNKLIIIKSLTFKHCDNCLEYQKIHL